MKTTSLEAQQGSINFKEKHHSKILNVLDQVDNLTYRQISLLSGLEPVAVARRMSETVSDGKVKETGKTLCPISRTNCTTYSKI